MPNNKFLQQIADYYLNSRSGADFSDITFIFQNKRSAKFLRHYFRSGIQSDFALLPRFTTFPAFAARTANQTETDHFQLLFLLYDTYVKILKQHSPSAVPSEFDKFIFWGDMILEDFDVIDSSLADAEKLYANLKGVKEITADYLTAEQKEVIERIWGHTNLTTYIERFWHHVDHSDGDDSRSDKEITRRFIALWEILSPLYSAFRRALDDQSLATPGIIIRNAAEIIRNTPLDTLARQKFVFVGLSDVSNAEIAIMQRLQHAGAADFFWDLAAPFFFSGDEFDQLNPAVNFLSKMIGEFPMPSDFTPEPILTDPHIDIIGVPSAVAQTKAAGQIIADMHLTEQNAIDTAIVLPDPSRLMSLMLSLPDDLPGLNITMGLPYSTTTFATLFSSVIALQRNARTLKGSPTFFLKDVLDILLHPHIRLIAGSKINSVRRSLASRHLYNVPADFLTQELPDIAFLFKTLGRTDSVSDASRFVRDLIDGLRSALSLQNGFIESSEIKILDYFSQQIDNLRDLIERYSVSMSDSTFLYLFERILMSRNINVEGTPLRGLQIMGVLETRSLDFDNIIFLSMNERSFPRREYVRTMIPNNIRRGYGLPSIEHTESFYSYYFFRAIARASRVTLFYDSRPPAAGRGEMSRYLQQLLYVFNKGNVTESVIDLAGVMPGPRTIKVEKSPEVLARLAQFKPPHSHALSPSSLKTYLQCGLRFYLEKINKLRPEEKPTDYLSAYQLGNILHNAACRIFKEAPTNIITPEVLSIIGREDNVRKAVLPEIAVLQGVTRPDPTVDDLNYEGRMMLSLISMQIMRMLDAEKNTDFKKHSSYEFIDGEADYALPLSFGDHTFNFKMIIDRIDRIDSHTLRFIDYKTGIDSAAIGNSIANLFAGDSRREALFQIFTYALAYQEAIDKRPENEKDKIDVSLHLLREIMQTDVITPITFNRRIANFSDIKTEFKALFTQMIDEIFNDTTPFTQTSDIKRCRFCPFTAFCGRNV